MMLATSAKKWRVRTDPGEDTNGNGGPGLPDKFTPEWKQWNTLEVGYGPGIMQGRKTGVKTLLRRTCDTCPIICARLAPIYMYTLTRLTFIGPDGTEHELRDAASNGKPMLVEQGRCNDLSNVGANRGSNFVSADGSAMTFVADADIYDDVRANTGHVGAWIFSPSGFLYLKDGTRYRIDGGSVTYIQDRNGNRVTFAYGSTTEITDSLNRKVIIEYDQNEAPYGLHDRITYRGFGGASRVIRISKASLSTALRSPYTSKTYAQLFPDLNGSLGFSGNFDPTVATTVWLPDNRSYRISYDSYGEVARVELPTGGAFEYDMTPGSGVIVSPGATGSGIQERQIYRRLKERRTYSGLTSGTLENRTVYTAGNGVNLFSDNVVKVEQFDAGMQLRDLSTHYFTGSAAESMFTREEGSLYSPAGEGREVATEIRDVTNPSVVLTLTNNLWEQRELVSWVGHLEYRAPNNPPEGLSISPDNDVRLKQTITTLADTNQVAKKTFLYDQYNNQTDVYEHDFATGGPGTLLRHTHTNYLTTNPVNGANYSLPGVHIRSLPLQTSVYEVSGTEKERSRTTFEYDNYAPDTYHASIVTYPRPGFPELPICGLDSSYNLTNNNLARGNVTKTTRSLLDNNGNEIGSLSSYAQYDVAGHVVKAIDPRSTPTNLIVTSVDYSDHFGAPDGEARANSGASELNNVCYTYAFPTMITNALGHTFYGQFDYYLGHPVDGEDANGIVASGFYNDALDRPRKVILAANTDSATKTQTIFDYDDEARTVTTTSDLNSFNDPNPLKSQIRYDGLGRTVESRQYEDNSAYIAVTTNYDALSRAFQTSNPYRPGENILLTTSVFDGLGRVRSITTPDGAMVSKDYSGTSVLATDQLGKQRMSNTNALGQVKDVWEITAADSATEAIAFPGHAEVGAGYRTSYSYDALDNLMSVTQGTQLSRTFAYNSLSQLTDATNPESGHVVYDYDLSGNLWHKTDARLVTTTYGYDALNRNKTVDYSNTTTSPDATRLYDGATNGKGRLQESYFGGSETIGAIVEHTKILSYDALGRPREQVQRFKTASVWSGEYKTQRTYNLAGGIINQTYPSGNVVSYTYDNAGRVASFAGNLGGGASLPYSTDIKYSPFGGMTKEGFGTDTAIYNKLYYNSRGQLAEIREGTSYTGPSDTGWERGAIINYYSGCWGMCGGSNSTTPMTDNNGNLKKQEIFIPGASSWLQQYDYDDLNRLRSVAESSGGSAVWRQEYVYDRFGNRRLEQDPAKTFGAGINKQNFELETATNRLLAPGDSALTGANLPQRKMRYDAAGNLTNDSWSSYGSATPGAITRGYDAENRMTSALDSSGGTSYYNYDADSRRVRRKTGSIETWQVYGMDSELLAEYAANASPASPQKEYGYRNGQLLITAEGSSRSNVASAANGGTATAQNFTADGVYPGQHFQPSYANDGTRYTSPGGDHYWRDEHGLSSWIQLDFNGSKSIDEVDVYTMRDDYTTQADPSATQTFANYGVTGFTVQYWNGSAWTTVTGGSVTSNNLVWKKLTFTAVTTSKIRVVANTAVDGVVRIAEVEAWGTAAASTATNVAAAANGGTATAQNYTADGVYPGQHFQPSYAIDSTRYTTPTGDHYWRDEHGLSSWLQIDFNGSKTINEIDVYTMRDDYATQADPSASQTFANYGVTGFTAQYWNGSAWTAVTGGTVTGNNLVWKKINFTSITTSKIRVVANTAVDGVVRIAEVEAWTPGTAAPTSNIINWLVTDQLGTPRMIFDKTGALATVKRHDYLPFGEEIFAGTGGRTSGQGYSAADGVRQKFTQKERDSETGLDYFLARYYSSTQGRFISVDPLLASGGAGDPQTWNRYAYALNNPLAYVDPDGKDVILVIWATQGGHIGHAGIAVSNYKKVEERVKEGKKWVTKSTMVPDGTYTYRDLWPAEAVGATNYDENVPASYNNKTVTRDQLLTTDVTGSENYAPDGGVLLTTDYATDQNVLKSLDDFQQANPQYNGVRCNCSDLPEQGIETAAGRQLPVDENIKPPIPFSSTIVSTTPNQLFKATSALPNATVIKNPGDKVNHTFIEGVKGGGQSRKKKNED
jgi:RHS repeat-associated protein